jgi:hypothetical protein
MDKTKKQKTSFALSVKARVLIDELSEVLGISQASVVEQAVRLLARQQRVKLPEADSKEDKADAQR